MTARSGQAVRVVGSVLVRNEDAFIETALRNVSSFCDRIHVLDHMSTDRTRSILEALSRELDHVDVRRSKYSGDSHRVLEPYAGSATWVLVVDGDTLFDPKGLALLRSQLDAGRHSDVFRIRGHVLHCEELDPERGTASGFLAPPSRPIVQLFNFGALESWTGGPQRCHGGTPVFRDGYDWWTVRDLTETTAWRDDPLRFVHVCFLRRSSADPESSAGGRPNLNELGAYRRGLVGRVRRMVRRTDIDPRVAALHRSGSSWKLDKYRRGERMTLEAAFAFGATAT